MSDTPRTDEVLERYGAARGIMLGKLAKELERELNAAKELIREIRDNEVNAVDEASKFLRDHPIK